MAKAKVAKAKEYKIPCFYECGNSISAIGQSWVYEDRDWVCESCAKKYSLDKEEKYATFLVSITANLVVEANDSREAKLIAENELFLMDSLLDAKIGTISRSYYQEEV